VKWVAWFGLMIALLLVIILLNVPEALTPWAFAMAIGPFLVAMPTRDPG